MTIEYIGDEIMPENSTQLAICPEQAIQTIRIWSYSDQEASFLDLHKSLSQYEYAQNVLSISTFPDELDVVTDEATINQMVQDLTQDGCLSAG